MFVSIRFVDSLEASYPGYIVRVIGGAFFLLGMCIMLYNVYLTTNDAKQQDTIRDTSEPEPALA